MRTRLQPRAQQKGLALIVMLAILSILLLHMAANLRTLHDLDRELQVTEQRQLRRLNGLSSTNASAADQVAPPATEPQ